jgi:hypothetical protein
VIRQEELEAHEGDSSFLELSSLRKYEVVLGWRANGSAVDGEFVKARQERDVPKRPTPTAVASQSLGSSVSQGEVEVGEKFSRPRLYTAATPVKAARMSLTRCGAVQLLW